MSTVLFAEVARRLSPDRDINIMRQAALGRGLLKEKQGKRWLIDEEDIPRMFPLPVVLGKITRHQGMDMKGVDDFSLATVYRWETILSQLKRGKVSDKWVNKGYGGKCGRKCRNPQCRHDLLAFPTHHNGYCMQCMMFVVMPGE